jgi:hypothetical protein
VAYTQTQLTLFKIDIGVMTATENQVTYFGTLLDAAAAAIARKGIRLVDGSAEDDILVVTYDAWLYRKRNQTAEGSAMPRMLRVMINDRLVSQKMKPEEATE